MTVYLKHAVNVKSIIFLVQLDYFLLVGVVFFKKVSLIIVAELSLDFL